MNRHGGSDQMQQGPAEPAATTQNEQAVIGSQHACSQLHASVDDEVAQRGVHRARAIDAVDGERLVRVDRSGELLAVDDLPHR